MGGRCEVIHWVCIGGEVLRGGAVVRAKPPGKNGIYKGSVLEVACGGDTNGIRC